MPNIKTSGNDLSVPKSTDNFPRWVELASSELLWLLIIPCFGLAAIFFVFDISASDAQGLKAVFGKSQFYIYITAFITLLSTGILLINLVIRGLVTFIFSANVQPNENYSYFYSLSRRETGWRRSFLLLIGIWKPLMLCIGGFVIFGSLLFLSMAFLINNFN